MNTIPDELVIGVFDGATDDILFLDFEFLNLKQARTDSPEFQQYLESFVDKLGSTFYYSWQHDGPGGYKPNMYAFFPIDLSTPVNKTVFEELESIILIMLPSEFQLTGLAYYQLEANGKYRESYAHQWDFTSHWYLASGSHHDSELLRFNPLDAPKMNAFILNYFDKKEMLKDFGVVIGSYIEAFSQKSAKMAYINLCIALEAITKAENEITYRIRRNCAVINANSKNEGRVIFENVKHFYALRSRIVHGAGRLNYLSEYFFKLRALVSRTIIEIMTFDIKSRKELEVLIDENGFGDKENLGKSYFQQKFNAPVMKMILEGVPKYKERRG
jgi:hypothetical protein